MAKVKLGLDGLSPQDKIALATSIKTLMTGNASFATPNPTLAAVGTATTTAQTKLAAYDNAVAAVATALTERDDTLETLCALLTQLGAYVENVSGGDAAKIESAGMSVKAAPSPVALTKVLDVKMTASDYAGAVDSMWKPVRGAKAYELQSATDPNLESSWSYRMTSGKSSATVSGLTSGSKLWLRVRAIGAGNEVGPWSDPAEITVP